MTRPDFITNEDIERWDNNINNDSNISPTMRSIPIIKEVCYAGIWIAEELWKIGCPDILISRIQFTAGKLSYGRDIWGTHLDILEKYKNDELNFEEDETEIKN